MTAGSNYDLTFVSDDLTITRATLTITADDKERDAGTANPAFTLSYSGFVSGDDVSDLDELPTATTAADENSEAGTYDIVLSGGTDNNYAYVFVNGTLTVIDVVTIEVTGDEDFGQVILGYSGVLEWTLENTGNSDLEVRLASSTEDFKISPAALVIPAGESKVVQAVFIPTEAKSYEGVINMGVYGFDFNKRVIGEGVIVTDADDQLLSKEQLVLYPNPASDVLTLDLSALNGHSVDLLITDANGKSMLSMDELTQPKLEIDVSSYSNGVYIIRLQNEISSINKKVIIKR